MGKQREQKKKQTGGKFRGSNKQNKICYDSPKAYDRDTAVFISLSQELKEEGNKLFQKRDYEVAMLKYDKAIKLLRRNHADVSYLRSNMAACYMQLGLSEYPRAIHECNLALEVTPTYTKALLKRARCYEALKRLDLALRDASRVLQMESNNFMATEIAERVKATIEQNGGATDIPVDLIPVPEYIEPPIVSTSLKASKDKVGKKKSLKIEKKADDEIQDKKVQNGIGEPKAGNKTAQKHAKGRKVEYNQSETGLDIKKDTKKKRGKKAKNKEVRDGVHVEKAIDKTEGMDIQDMTNEEKNVEGRKVADNQYEIGIDVKKAANQKEEKKTKNKRVPNGIYGKRPIDNIEGMNASDISDEEKNVESRKVEYNRFEILNDVEFDVYENEEKKAKNNNKVPNGVCEKKISDMTEENNVEDVKSKVGIDVKKAKNKKVEKKAKNKKAPNGVQGKASDMTEDMRVKDKAKDIIEDRKAEDKLVVEEIMTNNVEAESRKPVKLIFGDDIRFAQVPVNCSILKLREIVCNRFPSCKAILIKYKDREGDLVTITTNEEFRWAESSVEHGSMRLFIIEVNPDQDPLLEKIKQEKEECDCSLKQNELIETRNAGRSELQSGPSCIDDWIIHFAHLFKDYIGFESDCYLDLHDVGVKLYSEAMEGTVTSEEAQDIFSTAEEKFQEMAALALFNWGNVHMSRARRRVFTEYNAGESVLTRVRDAYSWAQKEYSIAGRRFEEALKIKPNFYEGIIALGQQQFELAKLYWYYAISTNADLESWPSSEVFQLYNNAGKNMERGMQMGEEALLQHLIGVTSQSETDKLLQQMKLGNLFKEISAEKTAEQAANIRSQLNLLWGTMLYERSVMEFKLGLPAWQHCLEAAADKIELAGASSEDIAVMIKNHCSNSLEGFNVDETEQAWNEMYDAIRWQMDIPALCLEPLLRQRVSKIHHALDHA